MPRVTQLTSGSPQHRMKRSNNELLLLLLGRHQRPLNAPLPTSPCFSLHLPLLILLNVETGIEMSLPQIFSVAKGFKEFN